ncbi:MAG: hypothetical protein BM564_02400, partial [Bacteroidetes bacterium MedPE-SWsnd-G2]
EGNYTVVRTWTATDACGNSSTATQTINVEDTTAPEIDTLPEASTIECNETVEFAQATATDNCTADVTLTFEDVTTDGNCEGAYSITRTWTATDACGNNSTATQTINVEDTTAPQLVSEMNLEVFVNCDDIPNIPELVFEDSCSSNITVEYQESSTIAQDPTDYTITRDWIVSDECGNEDLFTQFVYVTTEINIESNDTDLCVEDEQFDLFLLLEGDYDPNGYWEHLDTGIVLESSIVNPDSYGIGTFEFKYSETSEDCSAKAQVYITINDDCVVLAPCTEESVIISKSVTPNGDQWNEFFTITGIENCGFEIELQIYNRWGAKIFETYDYQNDWNGDAHNSSVGGSNSVPTGTYYYIINLKNSGMKPFSGPIYFGTK